MTLEKNGAGDYLDPTLRVGSSVQALLKEGVDRFDSLPEPLRRTAVVASGRNGAAFIADIQAPADPIQDLERRLVVVFQPV